MSSFRSVALAAFAVTAACSQLDDVERDRCGNGVLEPLLGEDCDRDDPACGAPESAAACRLLCGPTVAGAPGCPDGARCGLDGVCHAPGQTFELAADLRWTSRSLLVGDTTRDGFPELVGIGDQAIVAHLGTADGTYAASVSVPNLPVFDEPRMADVNGDGAQDLAIPVGFGLYTLAGNPFSVVQPLFQNTFPVPSLGRIVATAVDFLVDDPEGQIPGQIPTGELMAVLRVPLGPSCPIAGGCEALILGDGGAVLPAGQSIDRLAGDDLPWTWLPLQRDRRLVTALSFTDDLSTLQDEGGVYLFRGNLAAVPPDLTAVGAAAGFTHVRGPAWFADVDGDGLDDLIAAVTLIENDSVQVAWGRADGSFEPAVTLIGGGGPQMLGVDPVTWGDLTGDGKADLVSTDGIRIAQCTGRVCNYAPTLVGGHAWIDARIADVDGDGRQDVVARAAGAIVVDVLRGTELPALWNDSPVAAPGVVKALRTGDFDGSGTADIALITTLPGVAASDDLHVAFGSPGAAPTAPRYMGYVGEHVTFDTTTALLPGRFDTISDLMVIAERGGERGAAIVLGSSSQRMIGPLIPLGDQGATATLVEGIVAVPLDGDATADIVCLTTEQLPSGTVENVVRVYAAAEDGALHQRTAPRGVVIDTTNFFLRSARWVTIPAQGGSPTYIVGVDIAGRTAAIPVSCDDTACDVGVPQDLTGDQRGGDPTGLHAVDLDGDGDLDLLAGFKPGAFDVGGNLPSHVRVWLNDGGFGAPLELLAPDGFVIADVAAIDLALDGRPALVALARGGGDGAPRLYRALPAAGTGFAAFEPAALLDDTVDLDGGISLVATDVNGDGLPDLVATFGPDRTAPQNLKVLVQAESPGALAAP